MSQIPSTPGAGGTSTTSTGQSKGNDLRDVDMDQFMQLLIAQLQIRSPQPMDNSEMLQQISQIREISATNKLSDTLDSVLIGQNLTTASGLIGREVQALTDDAQEVTGVVDRVTVVTSGADNATRTLRVHIGDHQIDLKNIRQIQPVDA